MSVFTIKNRFLDPYDPFWICRILALKASTAALLMFLGHVFLKSPAVPMMYMLTSLIGVIASEILPAKSKLERVSHLIGVVFILSTTGFLFGMFSYFTLTLFLFVVVFTYVVLRFFVPNTQAAALPVLMIIWGTIQFEGGASTDLMAVANSYLYYFEFTAICAIVVFFFPDFTPNIAKSAFIRILESDVNNIGSPKHGNSNPAVLSALFMLRSKLPALPDSYQVLYESVVRFQNECMKNHHLDSQAQQLIRSVLLTLIHAIDRRHLFPENYAELQALRTINESAYVALERLIEGYDKCLA